MATQACPPFSKIPFITFRTSVSKFDVLHIIAEFFPPSSKLVFFKVDEHCFTIFFLLKLIQQN